MRPKKKSQNPTAPSQSPITTLQSQLDVISRSSFPHVEHHSNLFQKLYVSRLDSSLIASIVAETDSLDEAKKILDPLAKASVSEEQFQQTLTYGSGDPSNSTKSDEEYIKMDTLSETEAFQFLRATFPKPSDLELRNTIRLCDGDVRKTVDTLLNTEYLNTLQKVTAPKEEPRASDDSEEEDSIWAQRRPGGIARPRAPATAKGPTFPSLGGPSPQKPQTARSQSPVRSKWDALDSQITFLSQSLSLPSSKVRSSFHVNASSLPRTLRDLLKEIPNGRTDQDIVSNLKATFKNVDEESLRKIVLGTKHDLDCAMELARILEHDKYFNATLLRPSDLHPRSNNNKAIPTIAPSKVTTPAVVDDGDGSYEDMSTLQTHYLGKRNEAFAAASHSYRQSKSDTLHSGVAAYYANIGRDYDTKYRYYSHLAANRLVGSNSSRNTLDLHGVGIKDAVRIVEEAVTAWWTRVEVIRERGEVKAVESYVIVVGKGERQKGGSKLGPPVGAWLRRNGWGFQEARGEFVVWGLRRNAKE
jgi:hypothetical protein